MHTLVHTDVVGKRRTIEKQLTQQAAINRVRQFVYDIQLRGIALSHVILFGSYARNEQHDYSDIDIALVSDSFEGLSIVDVEPFRDIKIQSPYKLLELHTYNTADFERGDNGFIDEEIKPKGIMIL